MNVREEERQRNSCPSRGLGLAAAAMGVGVGAALCCFFSKRPENPDGEGSTTGWHNEEPHTFNKLHEESDSYTTISEHSTTDTSMEETDDDDASTNSTPDEFTSDISDSETSFNISLNSMTGLSSDIDIAMEQSFDSGSSFHITISSSTTFDRFSLNSTNESESDMEWDVTNLSEGIPEDVRSPMVSFLNRFHTPSPLRQRNVAQERVTSLRDQAFRERSWSLEECSICFDVILKDQQVTTLPCTHHFHSDCITPWLQERQTCPNCRKAAE